MTADGGAPPPGQGPGPTRGREDPTGGASATGGPSAFLYGPGHVIMYGNPAFLEAFGASCHGQPAREAMADVPAAAFELMDRVLAEGRALARRIALPDGDRRLVVVPRPDPETGEVYGVVIHLRRPRP